MNVIIINLPPRYPHSHFKLVIEDRSDKAGLDTIAAELPNLRDATEALKKSVEENSP